MEMEGNETLINENASASEGSKVAADQEEKYDGVSAFHIINPRKLKEVLQCLEEDILAADAKWNLFIAACQSYRYDSCLKPFPPMFIRDDKDICSLLAVTDKTPSFVLLKRYLEYPAKFQPSPDVVNLLHWLLVETKEPALKTVPKDHFDNVLSIVPCELSAKKPDYMFELFYSDKSVVNKKWTEIKQNYSDSLFAYHGSRLENFHSIINYGLQLSLTKTPLFGHGVYLSSELLVSLPYSPTGFGWGKSLMGGELSVVALCEIIDHPSTHCQAKNCNKSRALASDSIAGEVPHKYYVVSNSEILRIRYLLVYARSPPATLEDVKRDSIVSWVREHKLLTAIVGYIVLLASVGLSNNQHVMRYYRMILNKAGFYY